MADYTQNKTADTQPLRPCYSTRPATAGVFGNAVVPRRVPVVGAATEKSKKYAAPRRSVQNNSIGAEFFHRLHQQEFDEYAALETRRI